MYRIAFLKQKAGDLHDQGTYRLLAGISESDSDSPTPPPPLQKLSSLPPIPPTVHVVAASPNEDTKSPTIPSPAPALATSSSTDSNSDAEYSNKVHIETARLSEQDKKIIQESFKLMERRAVHCGLNIMINLFSDFPQYKRIWPQFRSIPDSSLFNAPQLAKHAAVYMHGLRTIIDNMENEDKMIRALRKIAIAHVKWNIYKKHIMDMLGPVLGEVKSNVLNYTPEVEAAWRTLYDVIANLIDIFREVERDAMRRQSLISQ